MKFLTDLMAGAVGQILLTALFMLYMAACFVLFDAFQITNPTLQVSLGIAPFLALAFCLVRSLSGSQRKD
ncbi:hypothetical protein B1R32_11643 [Abditibacterium utsteinense]|uniref:Uncharacterized protein n=1 Tax=Abditibacterium utsteinense TaxID=1960156 RepID=A0A2S8SQK4_9BACT|nr:hypothetical protein [Abditibacterium utsteinense]PQV63066.1 hypothetical protein B1R32_11643 [Abditibacterium utsteinense]